MSRKMNFFNFKNTAAVIMSALMLVQSGIPVLSVNAADTVKCTYADESRNIVSSALYNISSCLSEKYVTAAADGNIRQWEALCDETQQWQIFSVGDGYCRIVSAAFPSLVMTVENGDDKNGNNICLSKYEGLSSQHFKLNRTGSAYYITAECSGDAAFDVYGQSCENGATIDQWSYWGGNNQKFYITPANSRHKLINGDLNGDGIVNIIDRIIMQQGCTEGFDEISAGTADLNNDGKNDLSDLTVMNGYFFGENDICANFSSFAAAKQESTAYLFAYFLGNAPEQEQLSYAVSLDGYHFNALNNGNSIWSSDVGTGCIRDPFIFKGEDEMYYLLATDMRSSLGWSSNRNIISARSADLINWTDVTLIEVADKYPSMMGSDRAWAPQAIYDPVMDSYMIYWANHSNETGNRTIMYYAYSKDLKKFDTDPALLFAPASGDSAIDSDIIFQNGKYYMYYKNETNKRIYLAMADNASGPYNEIKQISVGNMGVEGPNIYNLSGTDQWLLMSDAYGDGYYVMQQTTDLENFTTVNRNDYSFDFTPRHGYVIPINYEQYSALVKAYPSSSLAVMNTGTASVEVTVSKGEQIVLPEKVTASYTDGTKADYSVKWNNDQLRAIDTSKKGVYTVTGNILTGNYNEPFITERADPYIVDGKDGYYYFTASYPAYENANTGYDRIILRRSSTVAGLADAEEKTIWKAHSSGILAKHIWAPEMHNINGTWYMFFAAGSSSDVWAVRPYVLKCSGDPYNDEWTELGQMQASAGDTDSFTNFSLDMTYFEHDGKHYVIWAEIKGDSSLFMAQIDPSAPNRIINKPIMLTKPEYDWEQVNHNVNEGASVIKTDSKIYVFFSASGTGSEYCVGRLEADINADLMDISSWRKLSAPVLSTSDLTDAAGPGHNSFVVDENGDTLIVYHARPLSHSSKECGSYVSDPLYDPCRHTRIKKVFFDKDGTPIINMSSGAMIKPEYRMTEAVITVE